MPPEFGLSRIDGDLRATYCAQAQELPVAVYEQSTQDSLRGDLAGRSTT